MAMALISKETGQEISGWSDLLYLHDHWVTTVSLVLGDAFNSRTIVQGIHVFMPY